jgi:AraC-like DNA-binding protein
MEHMMARLDELVSLNELAAMVHLSRSYFCRAFKVTVGVTPYQWQLNARIRYAKWLILRGEIPLAQIALESGFSDQAHFTRVFRKFEGVCPGKWMRSAAIAPKALPTGDDIDETKPRGQRRWA